MRSAWLDGLKLTTPNRRARRASRSGPRGKPAGFRPSVELLDDRIVPTFLGPVGYAAGVNPYAIVAAHLNSDSVQDLAVVNYSDSTVSVLLGNPDGTFQEPGLVSGTGFAPQSIAVGDFDGDLIIDLATANAYDVSVMLGNGDGTFQPPSSLGVVGYPESVAVGDFNGDGTLDLGVTSNYIYNGYWGTYIDGYANVLVGNGDGTFSGPNSSWLGSGYHTSAAAANFNGDTSSDFVTINADYGTVSVLFGDPSGYLQGPIGYYAATSYDGAVAAGDVDGDGNTDLVTANSYYDSVSVLLGDGLGGFGATQTFGTGSYPIAVVIGDFDHQAGTDIATANYYSNDVSVLRGFGDGTFSSPNTAGLGVYPWGLTAGDFNGDSWLDLATSNPHDTAGVTVLVNDQAWPPPPPPTIRIEDAVVTEGNLGSTEARFTVRLSGPSADPITVHFDTADGSATGSDYTGGSGDVFFAPGETVQTIIIAVTGDRSIEPTETFAVNLSAPTNATLADDQGIGTILDNEPLVYIGDVSVTEGNAGTTSATFTVWLSDYYDADVTVHFDTANGSATGSDYLTGSGDVTIPAGELYGEFTVAVIGDQSAEPNETFAVNLSGAVNGGIGDSQGIATIIDDEPRITIDNVAKQEGNGNGKNSSTVFLFTVSLSAATNQPVTVTFATANGTATVANNDYQAQTATLTFAPNQTTRTISIVVIGDKNVETDEIFFINLSGASGNAFISDSQGMGTIQNDDKGRGKP